jgi:hypothetical protein
MRLHVKFLKLVSIVQILSMLSACSTIVGGQRQFDTPEAASAELFDAAREGDNDELAEIFGAENSGIYSSGDEVSDLAGRSRFSELYTEQHRIERKENGDMVLVLGKIQWPFPVPLAQTEKGRWYFQGEEGVEEILNRRIGENELTAISVCRTIVEAEREYYNLDPDRDAVKEYARKVISTPGKKDGLFWARQPGEDLSPIGPLVATAVTEGYYYDSKPKLYHGYYYRFLTEKFSKSLLSKNGKLTKGFALVAYPAQWGVSGVMSFLVSDQGVLLQRNLGSDTLSIASAMTSYAPGAEWQQVAISAH